MNKSRLNSRMQATIALYILGMFGGVLFLPAVLPSFHLDADMKQTIINLAVGAFGFYLGTSSGSAAKDERTAQLTDKIIDKGQ